MNTFQRSLILIVLVAVLAAAGAAAARPWYLNWGASAEEVARILPGDELVPGASATTTRGVAINAPASAVWPWLVQVGYKRAGWYNYDWLNGLMGAADFVDGHRSSDRVVPELQGLKVGDRVMMHPKMGWTVESLEPGRAMVLLNRLDLETGRAFELIGPRPRKYMNNSEVYVLKEITPGTTRLLVRDRGESQSPAWVDRLLEPMFFLQERAFMLGVKHRAERHS